MTWKIRLPNVYNDIIILKLLILTFFIIRFTRRWLLSSLSSLLVSFFSLFVLACEVLVYTYVTYIRFASRHSWYHKGLFNGFFLWQTPSLLETLEILRSVLLLNVHNDSIVVKLQLPTFFFIRFTRKDGFQILCHHRRPPCYLSCDAREIYRYIVSGSSTTYICFVSPSCFEFNLKH